MSDVNHPHNFRKRSRKASKPARARIDLSEYDASLVSKVVDPYLDHTNKRSRTADFNKISQSTRFEKDLKVCSKCERCLPKINFNRQASYKDGLSITCKDCGLLQRQKLKASRTADLVAEKQAKEQAKLLAKQYSEQKRLRIIAKKDAALLDNKRGKAAINEDVDTRPQEALDTTPASNSLENPFNRPRTLTCQGVILMKTCDKCNQTQSARQFKIHKNTKAGIHDNTKDGLHLWCKACRKAYRDQYYTNEKAIRNDRSDADINEALETPPAVEDQNEALFEITADSNPADDSKTPQNEYKFVCEGCGYKTNHKGHFDKHLNNKKPCEPPIPGVEKNSENEYVCARNCGYKTKRKGHFIIHLNKKNPCKPQVPDDMKICCKCNVTKLKTEFHTDSKTKDGLHYWCKACKNESKKCHHGNFRDRCPECIDFSKGISNALPCKVPDDNAASLQTNTKRCSKCHKNQPKSQYTKQKLSKDGLHCWCKACRKIYSQNYKARKGISKPSPAKQQQIRTDVHADTKECSKCKGKMSCDNFYKSKSHRDELSSWCKSCFSEYNRHRGQPQIDKQIQEPPVQLQEPGTQENTLIIDTESQKPPSNESVVIKQLESQIEMNKKLVEIIANMARKSCQSQS